MSPERKLAVEVDGEVDNALSTFPMAEASLETLR